MAIPQAFIQELLARADVVEIVGRHVQLKKGGANYMGLCPFHAEKSPSFTVSPSKQFYHCFGCGKHGNAIGFLMEHAGMNFVEAVQDLAQQFGMQIPEDQQSPEERARAAQLRDKQATLSDVLEKAGEAYRKQLKQTPRAVDYLKGRGLSGEIARRFGLGYAPPGWRNLASVFPKYDDALLLESGLVISSTQDEPSEPAQGEKRYDRFRDRIMFPIRNIRGECIGFGGRVLGDDKPKYLNSPETPVFSKGRELYGLFEARDAIRELGYALVTEGYMDVVALAQLGFPNAVATLGTACTPEHVHKLFRFTDTVVFSFDGDAAGRRAARKALEGALPYASDVRSVKFLFLPPEHDPDSFIRAQGQQAFAACVQQAVPLSRFLLDTARDGCALDTAEGRAQFARHAQALWTLLPDGALKRQLLVEIASGVQLPASNLLELWQSSTQAGSAATPGNYKNSSEPSSLDKAKRREPPTSSRRNPGLSPRTTPASRADQAVRLLLGHSSLWEELGGENQALLGSLAAPHGPLMRWLESQLQEHGAQAWGTLRESLLASPEHGWALELMQRGGWMAGTDLAEARQELRSLLNRLLVEQLKQMETAAIEAAGSDPQALVRYRELQQRRRALEAQASAIL